jgi:hypothetical protein
VSEFFCYLKNIRGFFKRFFMPPKKKTKQNKKVLSADFNDKLD